MKKVKLLLTMAVIVFSIMMCFSLHAFALTEGDWEFQLLNKEVKITAYNGEGGTVVIPENLAGCPVTSIGEKLLCRYIINKDVTSVEIRATLKEIPKRFADSQEKLEKVVFVGQVESIGENAFVECEGLREIQLPATLKNIGGNAFHKCKSLEKITLPYGMQTIGAYAFANSGLTEIDLSPVEKEYGGSAFKDCDNLKSVKLSPMIAEIPLHMFMGCDTLSELEIPNGVTLIGDSAFYDCPELKEVTLPSSLLTLDRGPFAKTGIRQIIIPYGTVSILSGSLPVFNECENLEAVFIPDTVTKMSGNMINKCPNAILYCSDGSYAEEYCREKGISYLTDSSVNSGIHVLYNGKRISFHSYGQNPEILEGRTLVPLRSIFEAMGADVEWDGATSTAIAKRGNVEVKITIGASEIYKNGNAIPLDVPAQLLNNRTMVPARVIAEAFGADVKWNGNGRVVLITE